MTATKSTTSDQLKTLKRLSQQAAAWLLGCTTRALRDWTDAPRNPDGTYNACELVAWNQRRNAPDLDAALLAGGADSPALERLRLANAQLAELRLSREREDLLPRDAVHTLLGRVAGIYRGIGEEFQRQGQRDVYERIEEALGDAERLCDSGGFDLAPGPALAEPATGP